MTYLFFFLWNGEFFLYKSNNKNIENILLACGISVVKSKFFPALLTAE